MIEKLEQSPSNTIGFAISGTVTKDDYAVMVPEVETLVDREGDNKLAKWLTHLADSFYAREVKNFRGA